MILIRPSTSFGMVAPGEIQYGVMWSTSWSWSNIKFGDTGFLQSENGAQTFTCKHGSLWYPIPSRRCIGQQHLCRRPPDHCLCRYHRVRRPPDCRPRRYFKVRRPADRQTWKCRHLGTWIYCRRGVRGFETQQHRKPFFPTFHKIFSIFCLHDLAEVRKLYNFQACGMVIGVEIFPFGTG